MSAAHFVDEHLQRWRREPVVVRGANAPSMSDPPAIYRTSYFRARYEERARSQIAVLLKTPRYRAYRCLRWRPRRRR